LTFKDDFDTILTDSGGSASLFVNTEDIDAQTGASTPSYGSASTITVIINKLARNNPRFPEGFRDGEIFSMFTSTDNTIAKFDKITYLSVDYQVIDKVSTPTHLGAVVYDKYLLKKIAAEA